MKNTAINCTDNSWGEFKDSLVEMEYQEYIPFEYEYFVVKQMNSNN